MSNIEVKESPEKKYSLKQIILFIIGILFALLIIGMALISEAQRNINTADKGARYFLKEFVPALVTWNHLEIYPYLSSELKSSVDLNKLETVFRKYSALGSLQKSYEPEYLGCTVSIESTRCNYSIFANFEKSDATISVGVIKKEKNYLVAQVFIQSDAFY